MDKYSEPATELSPIIRRVNVQLIQRMYCDHGYTIEDICLRLRYTPHTVQEVVNSYNLHSK